MKQRSPAAVFAAVLFVLALSACAKHDERAASPGNAPAPVRNPSDFPVYPKSAVVRVVPVDSAQMFAAIRLSDPHATVPKNYRGNEVILQSGASIKQLTGWVKGLRAAPPPGFHLSTTHFQFDEDGARNGEDQPLAGAQFDTRAAGRSVYVIVADPHQVRRQIGPVLDLIDNYTKVPDVLRGPIDETARKQIGYSVTELLDPNSPVGAAMAALKTLQAANRRAILVIDESTSR